MFSFGALTHSSSPTSALPAWSYCIQRARREHPQSMVPTILTCPFVPVGEEKGNKRNMMSSPTNPPVRGEVRKPDFFQPQVATGRSETEHVFSEHTYVPPVALRWPPFSASLHPLREYQTCVNGGGGVGWGTARSPGRKKTSRKPMLDDF